jgi:hypothetical protein
MTTRIAVHNGSHTSKTLAALKAAAANATGQARATLQALHQGLKRNPTAARGRHPQGASAMAKKHKGGPRKAARKRTPTHKTNPTHHRKHRRRSNPTGSKGAHFRGVNFGSIAMRGAATAGGGLAQALVARQTQRLVPSLPGVAHEALGSAVVAGAALYFGKGHALFQDAAIGAIATGITGIAREFMPGLFAGLDDEMPVAGLYEDPSLGALYEEMQGADDEMSGLYSASSALPSLGIRPAGL